jgi:hypothetical protein
MNKKEIELAKGKIEKRIKSIYRPVPHYIDVWYEGDDVFKAIVKHGEDEDEDVVLSNYSKDGECIDEIVLTDETYKHLYYSTALHQLNKKGL